MAGEASASEKIDHRIKELDDWRGDTLAKLRAIIKKAVPDVVEEWKWAKATSPGVPVWEHNGGICTGETYKAVVKLTFFKGASLDDPSGLFNSSLEGKVRSEAGTPEHKRPPLAADAVGRTLSISLDARACVQKARPSRRRSGWVIRSGGSAAACRR